MNLDLEKAEDWLVEHRYLVLFVLGLVLYIAFLGLRDVWYPDEPDIAEVALAMFNSGDWVSTWDLGAQVLSTQPTTFRGSLQPAARTTDVWAGRDRESLDPDDFAQGFATWSGTSFAAPSVAGRFLAKLIADSDQTAPRDRLAEPGDA